MLCFASVPQPFRVAMFRFGAVFGRRSTAFRSSRVDAMLCFSGSAFPSWCYSPLCCGDTILVRLANTTTGRTRTRIVVVIAGWGRTLLMIIFYRWQYTSALDNGDEHNDDDDDDDDDENTTTRTTWIWKFPFFLKIHVSKNSHVLNSRSVPPSRNFCARAKSFLGAFCQSGTFRNVMEIPSIPRFKKFPRFEFEVCPPSRNFCARAKSFLGAFCQSGTFRNVLEIPSIPVNSWNKNNLHRAGNRKYQFDDVISTRRRGRYKW